MSEILNQYLITALWSSIDEKDEPMDKNYSITDFSPKAIEQATAELEAFIGAATDYIDGHDLTTVAHDFWLTRNAHGAGFWDGDYQHGDKLTEIAKSYGTCDLYVCDDGLIYLT